MEKSKSEKGNDGLQGMQRSYKECRHKVRKLEKELFVRKKKKRGFDTVVALYKRRPSILRDC